VSLNDSILEGDRDFFTKTYIIKKKEKENMSYTKENNVVICKNLASDASENVAFKLREVRGALEAMIKMGVYPPGEYVVSRKGLKGNQSQDWDTTGIWGHTYRSAIEANAQNNPQWNGDHTALWVNRTDKQPVFRTTKDNLRYYAALSTATNGLFDSEG
tara:strand:- start:793 stop:1269 length:477 start_codon:yes stop_codon:yes gene_type:complete